MTDVNNLIETKVGLIPSTWNCSPIDEVSSFIRNGFVGTATPFYTNKEKGILYLRGYNVRENKIDLSGVTYITPDFSNSQKKSILQTGDMLTVQSGHIGTTAVVPRELEGANCHAIIITRFNKEIVNPQYIAYYLNSSFGKCRLEAIVVGSSVPHINTKDLKKIYIPLPPTNEQLRIADILSTWDAAIAKTEKLIAALEQRKKGLMQRLLTGQVRFPGFGDEWRETVLGEFFYLFSRKNSINEDLTILSCSTIHGIVPQSLIFDKRIASDDIRRYKVVEKGDLIYDPMLLWDSSIGFLEVVDKGVISPAYSTFKFREGSANREYFKYLLKTHYYKEHYKYISQGTNVRRRKAPVEAFLKLPVNLPVNISEQNKIVEVLTGIDGLLNTHENYLAALEMQKKGLMQRLLTGQVRVKIEE